VRVCDISISIAYLWKKLGRHITQSWRPGHRHLMSTLRCNYLSLSPSYVKARDWWKIITTTIFHHLQYCRRRRMNDGDCNKLPFNSNTNSGHKHTTANHITLTSQKRMPDVTLLRENANFDTCKIKTLEPVVQCQFAKTPNTKVQVYQRQSKVHHTPLTERRRVLISLSWVLSP